MTISNEMLDRGEHTVTYDTASSTEIWDRVHWIVKVKRWECIDVHDYSEEVNAAISKEPYIKGSVEMPEQEPTPDYYNKTFKGVKVDYYRVAELFDLGSGPRAHAVKYLLRGTNKDGDINTELDLIKAVRKKLDRWEEMLKEDAE